MSDVKDWFRRSVEGFGRRLEAVGDEQWSGPTPNTEWDVTQLANHVVDENLWAPGLLAGRTVEDVQPEIPADPLGDDPVAAWRAACAASVAAAEAVDLDATVHLSFGDFPAEEYLMQLFADHLIHAWDLARATGQDEQLDPELVEAVLPWWADRQAVYQEAGVIGLPIELDDASVQDNLIASTGRDPR